MQKTVIIIINDKKIIDCSGGRIQASGFPRWQPVLKHWILQAAFPSSDLEHWPPRRPRQSCCAGWALSQPEPAWRQEALEKQTAVCASDPKLFGLKYKGVTF